MFTIKVVRKDSQTAYCGEIYHIEWKENQVVELDITPRASSGRESYKVRVAPVADCHVAIYIENSTGKTIETIRLPKVKAEDLLKFSDVEVLHFVSRLPKDDRGALLFENVRGLARTHGLKIVVDREAPYLELRANRGPTS